MVSWHNALDPTTMQTHGEVGDIGEIGCLLAFEYEAS